MLSVGSAAMGAKALPANAVNGSAAPGAPASGSFSLDLAGQGAAANDTAAPTDDKAAAQKPADADQRADKAGDKSDGKEAAAQDTVANPADGGIVAWLLSALNAAGAAAPVASGDLANADVPGSPSGAAGDTPAPSKPAAKGSAAVVPPASTLPAVTGMMDPAASAVMPSPPASGDAANQPGAAKAAPEAAPPTRPAAHEAPLPQPSLPDASAPSTQPTAVTDAAAGIQSFARVLNNFNTDPAAPTPAPVPTAHLSIGPEHAEWPQTLADQVQWQMGHEVQEARLELHPRDLGSVQVQIRITTEGAEVRFAATHAQAREALQAAMPQLRALLGSDGLAMTQSHVGSQSSWHSPAQTQHQSRQSRDFGGDHAEEDAAVGGPRIVRVGLVDDFA